MTQGIERIRVTAIVDNETHYEGPLLAENGISLLIEVKSKDSKATVLMDTGMTGLPLINNARELGLDLKKVDFVIISHNHYDHTGGLLRFLKETNRKIPVIMHPDVFSQKYAILPSLGIKKLTYTGPPFTKEDVLNSGGLLLFSKESVPIFQGVMTSGEIERSTGFEKPTGFWKVKNGKFIQDKLLDDMALIIKVKDGIVILTGCGHSGIVNTALHAMKIGGGRIKAILGGFHLIDANLDRIERTTRELKKLNPEIIAPMHCTGLKAKAEIAKLMPSAFKEFYCGDTIEIG
ncbi:MAG TPA: MBL fold metallo-hydrolase [Candidatus Korarchaeota archaeon]|nr:MBL fold metallo-hydrolase [Candidatus Korarchaeota archaeon]